MNALVEAGALAAACAVITTVFAFSKLPMLTAARLWLARRKRAFWFNLASCPLCTSFWCSAVGYGIYAPRLTTGWGPGDWLVGWMAVWCGAALISRQLKLALVGDTKPVTLSGGTK